MTIQQMNGASERVVVVPDAALRLLNRAGLKPTPVGTPMDMQDVSDKCTNAGLTVAEKLQVKITLRNAGLVHAGKAIGSAIL